MSPPYSFASRFGAKKSRTNIDVACELQKSLPIYIPCFNNPTYTKQMIDQLSSYGLHNLTLIDNASTYRPMLKLLDQCAKQFNVIRLNKNLGPRHLVLDPINYHLLPDLFCLTDPDLKFNIRMPANFIAQLVLLSNKYEIGKVGLALSIADRDQMHDRNYKLETDLKIWEHEQQYWNEEIEKLESGDPVYKADIDTTFSVYNKKFFEKTGFFRALRVAGTFTCRHMPWYRDNGMPAKEEDFYKKAAEYSYYLRNDPERKTVYQIQAEREL
jgi:hypothetical protein